jgi:hypothetical protein
MEHRYAWETREQEFRYVALARGFGSTEAMEAYYATLAKASDPNKTYRARLERIQRTSE